MRLSREAMRLFVLLVVVGIAVTSSTVWAAAEEAPLADAVARQNITAALSLLEQQVDVNAAQPDGMTALHWAVYHDKSELVRKLLTAGADASAENRYGVTSLSIACSNGSGTIVELLLAAGCDPNTQLPGGETVLMTAARTGQIGPVRALLERGAKVDATERKGQTALMWAAAEGNLEVVDALLEAAADFRTPLKSGFTPLFFAVREGRTEVVHRLLEAGADVNDAMQTEKTFKKSPRKGMSPLMLAVENGHFDLATSLLEAGADPNDDRLGFTALHAMSWVRKPVRGDGDPPPVGSGKMDSLEFVRKLVAHGAKVNARHKQRKPNGGRLNRTDATPFLLACDTADIPLMQLLLELGADPLLPNAEKCTPLMAAAGADDLSSGDQPAGTEEEALEAVEMLLKLGADINAVGDNGETAMHGAAYKNYPQVVQYLADQGADINVWNKKNRFGWTPLMIARGHRHGNFRPSAETIDAVVQVMRAAGVEPSETAQ